MRHGCCSAAQTELALEERVRPGGINTWRHLEFSTDLELFADRRTRRFLLNFGDWKAYFLHSCLSTWLQQRSAGVTSVIECRSCVKNLCEKRKNWSLWWVLSLVRGWPECNHTDRHWFCAVACNLKADEQLSNLAIWGKFYARGNNNYNKHKLSCDQTCFAGGEHNIKPPPLDKNLSDVTQVQMFKDEAMFQFYSRYV